MGDITTLLQQARTGDALAFDRLFGALYPELRRIAHARLDRGPRDTLQGTTMLVHECYLKFRQAERLTPADHAHFLAYAATVMRSIVVDAARASHAARRGGDAVHQPLSDEIADQVADTASDGAEQILEMQEALSQLTELDPQLARLVEMRYFGGMKDAEIASVLELNERTVRRHWEKARLLLASSLRR